MSVSEEDFSPNVILISLDTFRADRLAKAPFISELGNRGWRSTQFWSNSNWTLPAHVSLLTSSPPIEHDVPGVGSQLPYLDERIPEELTTLAEAFQSAGYFTAATTDGGFLIPRFGLERGFDQFRAEESGEGGDSFLRHQQSLEEVLARRGGQPFFLFVHSYEIHDYFLNTAPYHRFVDPQADREEVAHGSWLEEIKKGTAPADYVSRLYDSGIRWVDGFVEELVTRAEAATPGEDLLVVITSDHGESFGDRPGVWHHGQGLWEEQLRVPLVVWGNFEAAPKGKSDTPASLMDLAPSMLAASGVPIPPSFDGRANLFAPSGDALRADSVLPGATIEAGRISSGSSWESGFWNAALIEDGWKYSRSDSLDGKLREEVCFHVASDPDEKDDRMSDLSSPCRQLAEAWVRRSRNSPAWALLLTSASEAAIRLELDDPAAVLGVRAGSASRTPIAQGQSGVFRWQPGFEGDQLSLLLSKKPQGEIRVGFGTGKADLALTWSDLESSDEPLRVGRGPQEVILSRVGDAGDMPTVPDEDPELLEQLEALGYAR